MNDIPETEERDDDVRDLDLKSTSELVHLLTRAQRSALEAVERNEAVTAQAIEAVVERLSLGGRLHYVGAGTSGRIAVLDAAEMTPTFGTPPDLVCAHIAGGATALRSAVEGAEDDDSAGTREMRGHVRSDDAVIGISASGSAPYVVAAIAAARTIGAWTAAIVNTRDSRLAAVAECAIVLATGAEPIAGSTRMKAGTAQKIVLNTISTAVMVRLGKVHDNLMVDVVASNEKLRRRALRLVMSVTGDDDERAKAALTEAGGSVKIAVVMLRRRVDAAQARRLLADEAGRLRPFL